MKNLIESFKKKYGEGVEIKVPNPVMTIRDNYPSPFSSGSNGYITKLRINPTTHGFEYYHNWWNYGWKFEKKYTRQACKALRQVI